MVFQLNDYLQAQSDRLNHLALNYAQPLIIFLKSSGSQYASHKNITQWENRLILLAQFRDKEMPNSVTKLDDFITKQLVNINQSNCSTKKKQLQSVINENKLNKDLFANKLKQLISFTIEYCDNNDD